MKKKEKLGFEKRYMIYLLYYAKENGVYICLENNLYGRKIKK